MRTFRQNDTGFTLLEVLIAIVITVVGLLGLLEALSVATEHDMKNQLRDEAVLIGEEQLNQLRVKPFDKYSAQYSPFPIRTKRWSYMVGRSADKISTSDSRELSVTVSWAYKNISSHHQVKSVRSP